MAAPSLMTEMQRDVLTELFNIGMGNAAASLSELLNEEISLAVPSIECVSISEAVRIISADRLVQMEAVEQAFEGDLNGTAFLFFSESSGLELVRRILGSDVALNELTEMETEALKEVANIILNACFGCIADILQCDLESGVPLLLAGECNQILEHANVGEGKEQPLVMLLSMVFTLPKAEISGNVTYLMTSNSMANFLNKIDQYLTQVL